MGGEGGCNRKEEGSRLLTTLLVEPCGHKLSLGHMLGAAHQHGSCRRGWSALWGGRTGPGTLQQQSPPGASSGPVFGLCPGQRHPSQAPTGAWRRAGGYQIFGEVDESLNTCWLGNESGNAVKGLITQPAWALSPCPLHATSMTALGITHLPPPPPSLTPPSSFLTCASFYLSAAEWPTRNGKDHLRLFH